MKNLINFLGIVALILLSSVSSRVFASGLISTTVSAGSKSVTFPSLNFDIFQPTNKATVEFLLNAQVIPYSLESSYNVPGTTSFTPGQQVTFSNITFNLPTNLPAGNYAVTAGVYSPNQSAQQSRIMAMVVISGSTTASAPTPPPATATTNSCTTSYECPGTLSCVNSSCVQVSSSNPTPVPTPNRAPASMPSPTAISGGRVKWNPGHYLASYGIIGSNDDTLSNPNKGGNGFVNSDIAVLNNSPGIVGYRAFVNWGALETTESVAADYSDYDFKVIDNTLALLRKTSKHLVLVVMPGTFGGCRPVNPTTGISSYAVIPEYIQTNPIYGNSPVGGSYGWMGSAFGSPNCASSTYGAALWNANVMARWNRLHTALGLRYDADPNFEGIMFQEDNWYLEPAIRNGYQVDESNFFAMLTNPTNGMLTNAKKYFSHTNVIQENTWLITPGPTQALTQWMIQNGVALGTADTYGQSYIDQNNNGRSVCLPGGVIPKLVGSAPSWGMDAYLGITDSIVSVSTPSNEIAACHGNTTQYEDVQTYNKSDDLRLQSRTVPTMLDIESGDMVASFTNSAGTTIYSMNYYPADICTAMYSTLNTSHAFWTLLGQNASSSLPQAATWEAILAALKNCPLHTAYPSGYPRQ